MSNSKKVKEAMFFSNGNVACFDENGNQIPPLQSRSVIELWAEWAYAVGYDPTGCLVRTQGPGGPGKDFRVYGSLGDAFVKPA